jgi:biotin carboxylase
MKVLLRVYEYKETLERECSSVEEATQIAESMTGNDPNIFIERYIELDTNSVIDISAPEENQASGL